MKSAIAIIFTFIASLLMYASAQCNHRFNNNNNNAPRVHYVPIPYNPNGKNPAAAITAALLSARALNGERNLDGLRTLQALQALQAQPQAPTQVQAPSVGR